MSDPKTTKTQHGADAFFAKMSAEQQAQQAIDIAQMAANAKAAKLLAARECPSDLIEWGRAHGIPTFAEVTWQNGFLAGMRAASMKDHTDV